MQSYDFDESLSYWVVSTSQAVHRRLNELLMPEGITFRQSHVIGWLAHSGPMSQTELARRMMIEPPTLVRILDRMEQLGWLERCESSTDRRQKILVLTESASPIWDRIVAAARQVREEGAETLSAEEVALFKQLCRRVRDNLQRHCAERF